MKSNLIFKSISLICILVALCAYQNIALQRAALVAANESLIKEVEDYNKEVLQKIAAVENARGIYGQDGVFEGTGNGYGGAIHVEVTISQGYIDEIRVLSHDKEDQAYFSMAEKLIGNMIEQQSADVDVVSGATFSSRGIIAAVSQALEKAE